MFTGHTGDNSAWVKSKLHTTGGGSTYPTSGHPHNQQADSTRRNGNQGHSCSRERTTVPLCHEGQAANQRTPRELRDA
jgi:hypothetical protein